MPNLFIQSEMSVVEQEPTQALHYGEQVDLKLEVAKFEAGYMEHAFARFGIQGRQQPALEWTALPLSESVSVMNSLD